MISPLSSETRSHKSAKPWQRWEIMTKSLSLAAKEIKPRPPQQAGKIQPEL